MADTITELEKPTDLRKLLEDYEEELENRSNRYVKCYDCQHVLTSEDMAISINGGHTHVKSNPFGITFEFGCYGEALGCAVTGKNEGADSWFEGYKWRYLQCEACNQILGWQFNGLISFYGIRTDRIVVD